MEGCEIPAGKLALGSYRTMECEIIGFHSADRSALSIS